MGFLDSIFSSGSGSGSGSTGGSPRNHSSWVYLLCSLRAPRAEYHKLQQVLTWHPRLTRLRVTLSAVLGAYLKQFQEKGLGDAVNSWINTGPNKAVTPDQISTAIDPDIIGALSQHIGVPKEQISQILSQFLPHTVDQLTPEGRLLTRQEMARLIG
jgi:uncharacterized protein YidB (DUF937 family)